MRHPLRDVVDVGERSEGCWGIRGRRRRRGMCRCRTTRFALRCGTRRRSVVGMTAVTCAVGPCSSDRAPGSSYCAKHGPKGAAVPSPAAAIECPWCHVLGKVSTRSVRRKKGVSGGKATGAVLTGGLSVLVTGLSRREEVTELSCGSCGVRWDA